MLAVLLAVGGRLPDDLLDLLELLGVHVAVAVEVKHPEGDLELAPEEGKYDLLFSKELSHKSFL